jgi:uncharacterized protein (DUF2141 family)
MTILCEYVTKFLMVFVTIVPLCAVAENPAGSTDSSPAATGTVRIELTGLEQASGNVFIIVYDSKSTWLGENTVLEQKVSIAESLDGDLVSTDLQLPQGDYAITVYYDVNDNGVLDTNFIGIPKEPIASSNNAPARFGPPKYKDAVFTLAAEPVTQHIDMAKL